MNIIKKGIENKLISLSEDEKSIIYIHQNKIRNFNNPEEKVQAEAFLKLIFDYNYKLHRIKMFVSMPMGTEQKRLML